MSIKYTLSYLEATMKRRKPKNLMTSEEREELEKPRTPRKTIRAPARLSGVDVRDEDAAELLRVLIEEARLLREQMTALLEAILRKLEDIEQTQSS